MPVDRRTVLKTAGVAGTALLGGLAQHRPAWAMIVSAACSALAGSVFGAAPWILAVLATIWGVAVVADSALFSAIITEHSSRDYVGTALTLQMCGGFLLTMATIRLVPMAAATFGWRWAFLLLVPGPVLGTIAMLKLDRSGSSA